MFLGVHCGVGAQVVVHPVGPVGVGGQVEGMLDVGGIVVEGGTDDDGGLVDEDGFDEEGIDEEGFDEEGIDEEGFDEEGFDDEGIDEESFDDEGIDEEGFDDVGFDEEGTVEDGVTGLVDDETTEHDAGGCGLGQQYFGKSKSESEPHPKL